MSREERTRDAIGRTAKAFREEASKNGVSMTQEQARARVERAVRRDQRRNQEK